MYAAGFNSPQSSVISSDDIPYAIVGSFATAVWGDARMTRDIDIDHQLEAEKVGDLFNAFPSDDFYMNQRSANNAISQHGQFNDIDFRSGNKIDFMIAGRGEWAQRKLAGDVDRLYIADAATSLGLQTLWKRFDGVGDGLHNRPNDG